ncbi:MAG: hypothetical protein Q4D03_05985 [Bacteroidales bacterium]|nr:hypothetical protein [Bacteroidales bacterium]
MTVESKIVSTQASPEKLYNFLGDFTNFTRLVPPGQVQDLKATSDTCSFNVGGYMQITLGFVERQPYSLVAIGPAANGNSPMPFRMNINIYDNGDGTSRVGIVFDLEGSNPMMNMMLKPKLRDAADKLADQLSYFAMGL